MFKATNLDSVILVELYADGRARTIPFRSNEERALMVGSDPRADILLHGDGIAAVQFHLERRGTEIWLVPAYDPRDLRVNSARVVSPLPLEARNVVEFGGSRLEALLAESARHESEASTLGDDTWTRATAQPAELPSEHDATQLAMRALATPINGVAQQATASFQPMSARVLVQERTERMAPLRPQIEHPTGSATQVTERMAPVRANTAPRGNGPVERPSVNNATGAVFTTLGTEIMAPVRLVPIAAPSPAPTWTPSPAASLVPTLTGVATSFSPVARTPIEPPAAANAAQNTTELRSFRSHEPDGNTTLFEVPIVRDEPRLARHDAPEIAVHSNGQSPTPQGWSSSEAVHPISNGIPRSAILIWLTKLGLLAKTRPALVACCAAVGSICLATLLVVSTRALDHHGSRMTSAVHTPAPNTMSSAQVVPSVAQVAPVQIIETSTSSSARPDLPSTPAQTTKAPNDAELATAVAYLLEGRYEDARSAYAALSKRTNGTATYACLARLLTRAGSEDCSSKGQDPTKDCPGVHR